MSVRPHWLNAGATSALAAAAFVGSLALINGCALGARHVNLTYGPGMPPVPSRPPTYGHVAVAPLADGRQPHEGTGRLLGKVRNGYGMPTASVLANQDPVLWVTEGVARALANQGFTVDRVGSSAEARGAPTITGIVLRASGGMYMSMDANVSTALNIEHQGQVVARLQCEGHATRTAWTASTEEYKTVFEAAMASFAEQCGPRLAQILTGAASQ